MTIVGEHRILDVVLLSIHVQVKYLDICKQIQTLVGIKVNSTTQFKFIALLRLEGNDILTSWVSITVKIRHPYGPIKIPCGNAHMLAPLLGLM